MWGRVEVPLCHAGRVEVPLRHVGVCGGSAVPCGGVWRFWCAMWVCVEVPLHHVQQIDQLSVCEGCPIYAHIVAALIHILIWACTNQMLSLLGT